MSGSSLAEAASGIGSDLAAGKLVALGFECPLYVPVACEPKDLTRARGLDGNRAWSAGAGTAALATGLVECAWLFDQIHADMPAARATLDWDAFTRGESPLFVWEAFVTSSAKVPADHPRGHEGDARIAAEAFWDAVPNRMPHVRDESPVFSLVGAALLRAGLTNDLATLRAPCVVIKAIARSSR